MNKKIILLLMFSLNLVFAQTDTDNDGFADDVDNSPQDWNPFQEDVDEDGIGDWSDPTTIRVSLSESYASDVVSLNSDIEAALDDLYSTNNSQVLSIQFISSDDPNGHISSNASDLQNIQISASDVSLLDFTTKHLHDYELVVSHKNSASQPTKIDTLQLRIFLEENREQTQSPRTTTQIRTGLTENKFTNPFYDSNSEAQFGDRNTMWRAPGFGENQAFYGDINGDGLKDIIFADYRVNYFGRNFNIHQVSNPVFMVNDGDLNFNARYNNFENKTIIHSPNMAVEADLNGDGIDEILNFGEHYHTQWPPHHPHWNYIKKWFSSRDLVFNQDYNDESQKKLRYYSYNSTGLVDQYSKITPGATPNSADGSFFLSMYASGVGDIDDDGDNDIISTSYSSASSTGTWFMILKNDGNGNFESTYKETQFDSAQGHLVVHDVTGDGLSDVLLGLKTLPSTGSYDYNLALIKGASQGDFDVDINSIEVLDKVHPKLMVRNIYVEDINGDGSEEIIAYYTGGYGENNQGVADDEIPNQVKIYEIVDESQGYVNDITSSFFINNEDQMNFYAQSAYLRLQDVDLDGHLDLVPSFKLEPYEDYPENAYRGDWNGSKGFQFFKYYPHIGRFKVVDLGVFNNNPDNIAAQTIYNTYDLEDLNGDNSLEFIHVTDGRGVYIYEYDFGNYCGDSGNGQSTFELNNLENEIYLKNLNSISATPFFDCASFVPTKYYMAVGDSETNITNVLDWTEVSLSNANLTLSTTLNDYTQYYISLKAENSSGNNNETVTKSLTTYNQLLGDSDNDWDLDINDLNAFVNAWPGIDIGPASGAAPYMTPNLDNKSDVFDMNVFTRNWLWSSSSRVIDRINTNSNLMNGHNIEFIQEGNKISIIIPNDITSGRIQIDKSNINSKYEIQNYIGNMMLFQDDNDFYQISFGNLSKTNGLIVIEVVDGIFPNEILLQSFKNDGTDSSNKVVLSIPDDNFLYQNYPNPFNSETSIQYDLAEQSDVKITIFDLKGRVVKTLNEGIKDAGQHIVVWDGKNEDSEKVSSGIYFYQIKSKQYTKTKKMTLIKD